MKKHSLRERFSYWFDNRMAGGSLGLIKLLALVTLGVIVLIAFVLFLFTQAEERDIGSSLWDSMATVINAWMPSYEDGSPAYLLLMALAAVIGLFVTSVLIGIISSAIEEKITSLRRGNSAVLEENHIVVLGFSPGEYTLLRQLILASSDKPACIVVADELERDEMEQYIQDNVAVPKNVRIICRTADIMDPQMLERLAVREARSIIISPTDDKRTTKTLLAVSSIISDGENGARVGAIMSHEDYAFPKTLAEKHNVTTLQTYETIAKIIAHSCTEPGLSETFREVFNFEGSEMYLSAIPGAKGLRFEELLVRTDGAVPIGVENGRNLRINPGKDYVIQENDRILIFAEEKDSARLLPDSMPADPVPEPDRDRSGLEEHPGRILIIGCNETIDTVLKELPDNVTDIVIAADTEGFQEEIEEGISDKPNLHIRYDKSNVMKLKNLTRLAREADHVVTLSDHREEDEDADIRTIFLLLHLRDLRERYGFTYNITSEMRRENNQALIGNDDRTDFVVASNMSSLFLAQLSESPELLSAFQELLSNKGNELYLKPAAAFGCTGTRTVRELRRIVLGYGYLCLGYLKEGAPKSVFNPPLNEETTLSENDHLIVIGEE